MKISLLIVGIACVLQELQVPYKPADQFELKLDYSLKTRPAADINTVTLAGRRPSAGPLPFVAIQFKALSLAPEETRIRILTNTGNSLMNRKITEQQLIKFDMGFTEDLKERIQPHEYTLLFLSSDKEEKSRVVITVAPDGTFLVNEEVRGKL